MSKQKLKPCPFCGEKGFPNIYKHCEHSINVDNKKFLHSITTEFGFIVMCDMCCNSTMLWDTKQEAIKKWNSRPR